MKCDHCKKEIYEKSGIWRHRSTDLRRCCPETVATPEEEPEPEYEYISLVVSESTHMFYSGDGWIASAWQNHANFAGYKYEHQCWRSPRYYVEAALVVTPEGAVIAPQNAMVDGESILHPTEVRLYKEQSSD